MKKKTWNEAHNEYLKSSHLYESHFEGYYDLDDEKFNELISDRYYEGDLNPDEYGCWWFYYYTDDDLNDWYHRYPNRSPKVSGWMEIAREDNRAGNNITISLSDPDNPYEEGWSDGSYIMTEEQLSTLMDYIKNHIFKG